MPPKKQVEEKRILLGRPGNNLKTGIVGLANVGKSSLFNAMTKAYLSAAENFPFCTINPEESKVIVPSERFDHLCELYQKKKSAVPAFLTITDIAGLVRGAASGEGLGNEFLSHIRAVDALFQVVRCFDDADIIHIEGDVNPARDLEIVAHELRLKDIEFAEKHLEAVLKITRKGGQSLEVKQKREEAALVEKIIELLKNGQRIYNQNWAPKEIEIINTMLLLTAKPSVYLVNLSEKDYIRKKNKHLIKIKEWVDANSPGDLIIPFSVALEEKLAPLTGDELKAEEEKIGACSAFPKMITSMRKKMDLISFFTSGADEVREWTIRDGTKAPAAAGVIHNDLQKTFILAEILKYTDIAEYKDEKAVKAAGKLYTKGKDYVMEDGDVVYFRAAAGKT
ncbi:Obg-like ATPase [Hanseniaspora valbyensis]